MNRLILILLLMSFSALSDAEKLDTVVYRIIYNSDVKIHKESSMFHETGILEIGDSISNFYGLELRNDLNKPKNTKRTRVDLNDPTTFPSLIALTFGVYRNYSSKGKSIYYHYIHEPRIFYYEEDIPQIDWQLVSGDTTLLDYQCQKATCKFRGRDWTVYYTMDIPISECPWKLCGLPGLVLYARESLGEFTFSCAGIEKPENAYIEVDKRLWTKVGQKEMEEQLIKFYDDIDDWLTRAAGYGYLADKKKMMNVKKHSLIPCLIETFK